MLPITKSWNGQEVELAVGESFDMELPENATTGYQWKELPTDQSNLALERVKEDNVPRTAQGNLIAGGAHPARWRVRAIRQGTAVLELHYVGPAKQKADTFKITVRVK
jgi:predicted secreted protein